MIYKIHGDRWGGWVLGFTVIRGVWFMDFMEWPFDGRIFKARGFRFLSPYESFFLLIIWTRQLGFLLFFAFNTNRSLYWLITFRLDFNRGDTIFWSGTFEILMERVWRPSGGWFERLVLKFHSRINHSSFILKYLRFPGWYVEFSISDRLVSVLLV